jgi:hypothetical protein
MSLPYPLPEPGTASHLLCEALRNGLDADHVRLLLDEAAKEGDFSRFRIPMIWRVLGWEYPDLWQTLPYRLMMRRDTALFAHALSLGMKTDGVETDGGRLLAQACLSRGLEKTALLLLDAKVPFLPGSGHGLPGGDNALFDYDTPEGRLLAARLLGQHANPDRFLQQPRLCLPRIDWHLKDREGEELWAGRTRMGPAMTAWGRAFERARVMRGDSLLRYLESLSKEEQTGGWTLRLPALIEGMRDSRFRAFVERQAWTQENLDWALLQFCTKLNDWTETPLEIEEGASFYLDYLLKAGANPRFGGQQHNCSPLLELCFMMTGDDMTAGENVAYQPSRYWGRLVGLLLKAGAAEDWTLAGPGGFSPSDLMVNRGADPQTVLSRMQELADTPGAIAVHP